MPDIAATEQKLIDTLKAMGLFREVSSAGRDGDFKPLNYPAAAAVFLRDRDTGSRPRAIWEETYAVLIRDRNLADEKQAARGVYGLLDQVRDAIHGLTLGLTDIEPFACTDRRMIEYKKGLIDYQLTFTCRRIGGVPTE